MSGTASTGFAGVDGVAGVTRAVSMAIGLAAGEGGPGAGRSFCGTGCGLLPDVLADRR
jgi:hypothetical protein